MMIMKTLVCLYHHYQIIIPNKVKARLFTYYGLSSNVVTYTPPPVTVYISGPTNLTSGQSGTFTANVTNGVPSTYSYSWSKYQYCNDRSQSDDSQKDDGTRGITCGYWRPTGTNSSTLYASGSPPRFKLKCTVTDINGSATDYHTVTVNPW